MPTCSSSLFDLRPTAIAICVLAIIISVTAAPPVPSAGTTTTTIASMAIPVLIAPTPSAVVIRPL